jgi:hypothetical protein
MRDRKDTEVNDRLAGLNVGELEALLGGTRDWGTDGAGETVWDPKTNAKETPSSDFKTAVNVWNAQVADPARRPAPASCRCRRSSKAGRPMAAPRPAWLLRSCRTMRCTRPASRS